MAQQKPQKIKKLINIGVRENSQLKKFCLKNGLNESAVIERLIRNYLNNIKIMAETENNEKGGK